MAYLLKEMTTTSPSPENRALFKQAFDYYTGKDVERSVGVLKEDKLEDNPFA